MNNYVQVEFTELQQEQQDILIAQLSEAGFEGFEETVLGLKAFIAETKFDGTLLNEICYKYQLSFKIEKVEHQNWNLQWESSFQPVVVANFVSIRADFHAPNQNVQHEIIITPKMSFGTGHHATTYMMMEWMKEQDFSRKAVLDFGTGTGILAILAEKMGASKILAIDIDDWSIENAKENLNRNDCTKTELKKLTSLKAVGDQKFDIILANINKNVILENCPHYATMLVEKGVIIFSGLLLSDEEEIITALEVKNICLQEKAVRDNWLSIKATKGN